MVKSPQNTLKLIKMVESNKRHAQDHSYRDPGKIMGCNDPGKQYRV